ncbi:hypothetical protein L0U85_06665 [Glycomyces sp. L485]|uniref:hypothetical protein n=1 Tax=Glycomyces sp. L485 TaxID=2909235 RepID=UPI001F4AEAA4|nr:hypothetical protein [Glycomyces sp. L485]MCH7230536.1 hypothetical protein [Glycomyces sp. L485]
MTRSSDVREFEVAVADRLRTRDLVLFAIAVAALVAAPWMMIGAGSDPVSYRDASGFEKETPAWMGVPILLAPLLGWSGIKAYHLLRRPAAAIVGPDGIRLYPEGLHGLYMRMTVPVVDLPWGEVEQVVLWRLRRKLLWLFPAWESHVGVEKTTEWYEVSQREPTERQRQSREVRPNGSPVRLGSMLKSRSVRLSPRAAVQIAEAAARFAPRVKVVDERYHGRSELIEPNPSRSTTVD